MDCGLDVEIHQRTRKPLGWLAGFGGGFAGFAMAPGGSSSPASGVLSPEGVYKLSYQAKRYQGDLGVLTEALGRPELDRRSSHGGVRRRC